jgi:uncharacterized protein (DUF58 family)
VSGYSALLDAVRGLRWPARHAVPGGPHGVHRSTRRGTAAEFSEYRSYRPGDDPRRLDWKLLARSDRAFVRLTDDHAVLPTVIVVDASVSMAFPEETAGKWRHACGLAVGLAAVAHAAGDPVGLVVGGREVRRLEPRTRRGVVGEIARVLDETVPGGERSLVSLVNAAGVARGRLVVISDFLGVSEDDERAAVTAMRGWAECYAVHVIAAEEMSPAGDALVRDPEWGGETRPMARLAYERAFGAWREGLARSVQVGGIYVATVTTDRVERAVRTVVLAQS